MAEEKPKRVLATVDDPFFHSYGDDYALSVDPSVLEVYAPKLNMFSNDREYRISFGRLYPERIDSETIGFRPRYSVAVYMPVRSAIDMFFILRNSLVGNGHMTREEASDFSGQDAPEQADGGSEREV